MRSARQLAGKRVRLPARAGVPDDDAEPGRGKRPADGGADASRAAGDDRDGLARAVAQDAPP